MSGERPTGRRTDFRLKGQKLEIGRERKIEKSNILALERHRHHAKTTETHGPLVYVRIELYLERERREEVFSHHQIFARPIKE